MKINPTDDSDISTILGGVVVSYLLGTLMGDWVHRYSLKIDLVPRWDTKVPGVES